MNQARGNIGCDELFEGVTPGELTRRVSVSGREGSEGSALSVEGDLYEFEQLEPRILLSATDPCQAAAIETARWPIMPPAKLSPAPVGSTTSRAG